MTLTEIQEPPPVYKEETCAQILAKYAAPGKPGLLSSNPLDEILAYLESVDSLFVDPHFPPNQLSLNDQPNSGNGLLPQLCLLTISALTGIEEWRRLDYLCDNPELFLDGATTGTPL